MSERRRPPATLSRRAALGALGAGAAAAAGCRRGFAPAENDPTGRALAKPPVPGAEAYGTHEERWFRTSCGQCSAACGIRVRVVEGRAVRIEGNHDNPLNRGGVGARGLSALQGLYDADRIPGPLARRGGALVPVSWEEALGSLAADLAALRARGEADRLLVWCGEERGLMRDLLARLCRAYGTPNLIDGRAGRSAVLAQAMAATTGVAEAPIYGWEHARTVLSLEAGLVESSCQSVYLTRMAAHLRRDGARGARLVHLGPVLDLCAYNADEWIRVRPGTSGAVALGLARLFLRDQPGETALPSELVAGAAEFRAFVERFTPDHVAAVTGIDPRSLERLAERVWQQRPAFAVVDERSVAFSNGLDGALAAMALNAVLGAFWAPAGGVGPAPAPPFRDWQEVEPDPVARAALARPRLDGAAAFPGAGSVHETLPEAIAGAARAPAIALLWHANPAYARQQPDRWRRALAGIPRVVSFSPYRDETVEEVADLVLPDHTFLERWEIAVPAPALDRALVGVRVPVIAPVHDTRASGDVVLDLARRIGGPVAEALAWSSFRAACEERLEGLRQAGRGNLPADSPGAFTDGLYRAGFWVDLAPPPAPPVRVELHARWAEPTWAGDPGRYPLRLLAYRPLGYAEGSGANQPWLRTLRPRPGARPWTLAAHVHPASAAGLADGELALIESEWGAIRLPLEVDDAIEPGVIAIPMGGGHRAFG
ncbi:MAG TPA: molybdopterin-dependent oxidoreductase, partial [Kofleriaceae bacterium]|nr:molybdopterin-dependent oxidoreductase [Kofleriaceae bacterium]